MISIQRVLGWRPGGAALAFVATGPGGFAAASDTVAAQTIAYSGPTGLAAAGALAVAARVLSRSHNGKTASMAIDQATKGAADAAFRRAVYTPAKIVGATAFGLTVGGAIARNAAQNAAAHNELLEAGSGSRPAVKTPPIEPAAPATPAVGG